ncbi:DUF948 domain-containing protein [Streptococcus tangpeifui]|uniref:DUF948 domain-containing protein n=1 Tax=Streptococcus tangpeifui TaxID=2709400 RepID=UPI0013EAF595|nr:DUF948 domain-containing protein [Streptococcus sp. ZJ373]
MVGYAMLIIALAFVALVIYLAIVLHKVAGAVDETKRTLTVLTADVDVTLHQTNDLIAKANVLVDDINGKVATIDPLFDAVADLSLSVSDLNSQARVLGKKASNAGSNAAKAGTVATALRFASKLFKSRKKGEE